MFWSKHYIDVHSPWVCFDLLCEVVSDHFLSHQSMHMENNDISACLIIVVCKQDVLYWNSYILKTTLNIVTTTLPLSLLLFLDEICCLYVSFSVRPLSVLRGHSFFSSQPQRPMTSDFEGFLYQILSITLFSDLNSWERASISLSNVEFRRCHQQTAICFEINRDIMSSVSYLDF